MAKGMTKLAQLLDPQVIGAYLDVKMIDAIKLTPMISVNRELEGRPGSKLTLPKWGYTGDAADLAEAAEVTFDQLVQSTVEVGIKKIAKGIELTDEAILSGYGNPVEQVGQQLLMGVASKIEADLYDLIAKCNDCHKIAAGEKFDKYTIVDMKAKYREDMEADTLVLFVTPELYAKLVKDPDFVNIAQGEKIMSGHIGTLFGVNIVVANRVTKPFMMKQGAIELLMKRNVMVETDRNIKNFTNQFVVSDHYGCYVKYADRIVRYDGTI